MHIWMILRFGFCSTHSMGFLSMLMCFLEYYRQKDWMCNSAWRGWMSFVTKLSNWGTNSVGYMKNSPHLRWSKPVQRPGCRARPPACTLQTASHQHSGQRSLPVQNRFQDHGKLMFLSLIDPQHFQIYRKKFPQTAFSSLTESHGTLFDLPWIKTELTVIYATADFEGKGPTDLHDFLRRKNMIESMGQLYALACFLNRHNQQSTQG